jgi:hypothetical protein
MQMACRVFGDLEKDPGLPGDDGAAAKKSFQIPHKFRTSHASEGGRAVKAAC